MFKQKNGHFKKIAKYAILLVTSGDPAEEYSNGTFDGKIPQPHKNVGSRDKIMECFHFHPRSCRKHANCRCLMWKQQFLEGDKVQKITHCNRQKELLMKNAKKKWFIPKGHQLQYIIKMGGGIFAKKCAAKI